MLSPVSQRPHLVALVTDPSVRVALSKAASEMEYEVLFCENKQELECVLRRVPVMGVLVGLHATAPQMRREDLKELRWWLRGIPMLACSRLTPQGCGAVLAAAAQGLDGFFFPEIEDVLSVLDFLEEGGAEEWALRALDAEVGGELPVGLRQVLERCIRHARDGLTVRQLARELHVNQRTVLKRLEPSGMTAGALIAWGKVLVAARLLEKGGTTIEQIALYLGLSSGAALHAMLKRYAAMSARDVRRPGGSTQVLHAIVVTIKYSGIRRNTRSQRARKGNPKKQKRAAQSALDARGAMEQKKGALE